KLHISLSNLAIWRYRLIVRLFSWERSLCRDRLHRNGIQLRAEGRDPFTASASNSLRVDAVNGSLPQATLLFECSWPSARPPNPTPNRAITPNRRWPPWMVISHVGGGSGG